MSETPTVTAGAAPAAPAAATPAPEHEELDPRRWLALASVMTALFMVLLDISIVNVAIPAIRANLAADNADIQFVVAGYGLAYAVMLITGGRLGDIFGRKRLFMIGMTGFVVASALCGLAQSAVMLDLSRVLQGFMAALMYPQVLSVIQVSFPPHERARVFGLLGAVIGIATITGPLVGGLIIRDDLSGGSWRWIFLVNLPIGIASLIAAYRVVTESRAPHATRLDLVGVAIATVGLLLLVYPLVEGQTLGWPLWTFVCMGSSPFVLALFVLYERSLPSTRFPLVQLSMFSIPAFRIGVLISAVFIAGIPAFFFTFSLMLQVGLGFSALQAGLTTIPWSLGSAIASAMSTRVAPRLGKWTIAIGSSLLVLGVLAIILTLHLRGVSVTGYDLIPSFFVSGLGLGTVIAPLLNVILAGVPPRDAGSASGVLTTFQQLGGAVGVAVVGVVFFGMLSSRAPIAVTDVTPALRAQLSAAHLPPPAADSAVSTFSRCFEKQAASSDPTQPVPGCPSPAANSSNPVNAAIARAARHAVALDFVGSVERTLFFNVGFWLVTGVLSLSLPRTRAGGPPGAAATRTDGASPLSGQPAGAASR
jgi:EmrB/QacA subfamily drug resistance transporter